jgi:hypothetical protein
MRTEAWRIILCISGIVFGLLNGPNRAGAG